jgi:nucleotide-binding universal stress UspA family protein
MLQTIVVPVEGSDHSEKALDMAIDYALKHGSALKILSVWKTVRLPDNTHSMVRPRVEAEPAEAGLKSMAQQVVDAAVQRARDQGVSAVEGAVKKGQVARTIVTFAETEGADAIIMGSRGLGDVSGLLLGSVSHKVCNMAACTCIVVK